MEQSSHQTVYQGQLVQNLFDYQDGGSSPHDVDWDVVFGIAAADDATVVVGVEAFVVVATGFVDGELIIIKIVSFCHYK